MKLKKEEQAQRVLRNAGKPLAELSLDQKNNALLVKIHSDVAKLRQTYS
jgi:hypothetical protein